MPDGGAGVRDWPAATKSTGANRSGDQTKRQTSVGPNAGRNAAGTREKNYGSPFWLNRHNQRREVDGEISDNGGTNEFCSMEDAYRRSGEVPRSNLYHRLLYVSAREPDVDLCRDHETYGQPDSRRYRCRSMGDGS